jgi:hypothetical protein
MSLRQNIISDAVSGIDLLETSLVLFHHAQMILVAVDIQGCVTSNMLPTFMVLTATLDTAPAGSAEA